MSNNYKANLATVTTGTLIVSAFFGWFSWLLIPLATVVVLASITVSDQIES